MEKKINYLARSFTDIKSELINFSKKYYPEISDSFNDASVGAWFIDLVSAVGDNLSYHTDRMYQENNIDSANLKSSVLNAARVNGVHIPGPKASMCEIELSCVLPVDSSNISSPDWEKAPIVKLGSVVGNNKYQFELSEDVNFTHQFNSDGISNRKFTPNRDNNGVITGYTITKTTIAFGGKNKIYKKVLTDDDIKPFMEVVLPEKNIMNVESVIFKESSNFNADPQSYEYYIDKEEYKFNGQAINTYRFFEVESLSDQFMFSTSINGDILTPYGDNILYQDVTETLVKENKDETEDKTKKEGSENKSEEKNTKDNLTTDGNFIKITRYYKGKWMPITQKFITEYTDNGYLKLTFGCGNGYNTVASKDNSKYAEATMTKILNNDLLGVLPKAGWTMFVLYRTSGGVETNLAPRSINSVLNANVIFPNEVDSNNKTEIIKSLKVINISPSVGGKDFLSTEEMKNYMKYAIQEQKRCVTVKDYKSRIMSMPPKFGCPFRCNAIEDNNKIVIPCLGIKANGTLDEGLPKILKENIIEYLSHFKTIGDYVELKSGKIYNIGFIVDVFVNKNYNPSDVVKSVINKIKDYMSVSKHDMGEDIFIGDLEKEINLIDGVTSLIKLRVYSLYNGKYSPFESPLPKTTSFDNNCMPIDNNFKVGEEGSDSFQIDLSATNGLLGGDYDSMYEILKPEVDIKVRTKIV